MTKNLPQDGIASCHNAIILDDLRKLLDTQIYSQSILGGLFDIGHRIPKPGHCAPDLALKQPSFDAKIGERRHHDQ